MNAYERKLFEEIKILKKLVACLIAKDCECQNSTPTPSSQNNKIIPITLISDTGGSPIDQLVNLINSTNDFIVNEDENVVFNLLTDEGFEYQYLFNVGKGHFGVGNILVNNTNFTPIINLNLITAATDNPQGTNGAGTISSNVKVISAYDGHLQFIDSPEGVSGVLGHTVLSLSEDFLDSLIFINDFPTYLSDNNVVLAQPNPFTAGRIPYTTDDFKLQDSSRLTWDNINSTMELNGSTYLIKLKENINNRFMTIGNPGIGSGSLQIKNQQGKTMFYIQNPSSGAGQAQVAIGNTTNIPTESQLFIFGGQNGANIDMRGSIVRDESNTDWEGNDWDVSPNSIGVSYFGSNYAIGGTIMGYPKIKTGVLRWGDADYALIVSNKDAGVTPIRFGINNIEIANVNNEGISYQSDFSVANASNPRWLTDKEYVDNKTSAAVLRTSDTTVTLDDTIITSGLLILTATGTGTDILLPNPADFPGLVILFTNMGSAQANLNTFDGGNGIFAGVPVNTIDVSPGVTYRAFSDGVFFVIQ